VLVGVDFDNTIVCYDRLFHKAALEKGLIPPELPAFKGQVRDYMRANGAEDAWTELQGYVYGPRMLDAAPFAGTLEFFKSCKARGIHCCIISHRTMYPFIGPQYDLHKAAREWIEHYGFYRHTGLLANDVYLELTLQDKLSRISQKKVDVFIDDLPEFLAEPGFPVGVERILFDPNNLYEGDRRFKRATTWKKITHLLTDGIIVSLT